MRPRPSRTISIRTATPARTPREVESVREAIAGSIDGIRAAYLAACSTIGLTALRPQEVSRRLGLNKNLTWKMSKVVSADDALEAAAVMPGSEGLEIVVRGFMTAGLHDGAVDALRGAFGAFESTVIRLCGSRAELAAMLDGIRLESNLESSRRAAFKALAGVFGVRARLRFSLYAIGRCDADRRADIALIAGVAGLQRLRPIGPLPVFTSSASSGALAAPFTPPHGDEAAPDFLLREFSRFPSATFQSETRPTGTRVEILDGPLGRIGESDLFFGNLMRGLYAYDGTPEDRMTELLTRVHLPSERCVAVTCVHRDVPGLESIDASWHSTLAAPLASGVRERHTMLPMDAGLRVFDSAADAPSFAELPQFPGLLRAALEVLEGAPEDYRLFVVETEHPPCPATLLVRWDTPIAQ